MKNKIFNEDNIKVVFQIYKLNKILKGGSHEIKGQSQDI